jgi:hypothetical protein
MSTCFPFSFETDYWRSLCDAYTPPKQAFSFAVRDHQWKQSWNPNGLGMIPLRIHGAPEGCELCVSINRGEFLWFLIIGKEGEGYIPWKNGPLNTCTAKVDFFLRLPRRREDAPLPSLSLEVGVFFYCEKLPT